MAGLVGRSAMARAMVFLAVLIVAGVARAEPDAGALAAAAARRFPQPVRVGDLLHRDVLQPVESQNVLGSVRAVVRNSTGQVVVVVNFGGILGFGARPIAVPVDAMVLVGDVMEIVAYTPKELRAFPMFSGAGTVALGPDAVIRVGLAKPSH
jgi:hypothetical protein